MKKSEKLMIQAIRREKVKALWHEGKTCSEIAKLIDSNMPTIMRDCRAMDLPTSKEERASVQLLQNIEPDPEADLWHWATYRKPLNRLV
ncbi:hypothetical protein THIAE_06250 [Thiomicrospira aerophila AL3]|uniref:Uncharacterized protein n=1 Tax=Thiomicrospira aerophila AL3 TaxID=717772 RepID=W0DV43_9GAMM|nr:hypothetical protein [Thiomicrospira aerophila]AHF02307.1 hypothetical protein THIAE_06250 [Thiomicrospira aerophila AL3]